MDAYEALNGIDQSTTITEQQFNRLVVEFRSDYLQAIKYEELFNLHRNPYEVAEEARRELCTYLLRIQNRVEMSYTDGHEAGSIPGKLIRLWASDKRLKSCYHTITLYCTGTDTDFNTTAVHVAEYKGLNKLLRKFYKDKNDLLPKLTQETMVPKYFEIEQREVFEKPYLKVYLRDEGNIDEIAHHIQGLPSVKRANVSPQSGGKRNLTVYPQKAFDISEVATEVSEALTTYYKDGVLNNAPPISTQAHFEGVQNKILKVLDEAQVSITLAMAWFTNEVLRDKLLEKQKQNVAVRIVIFDDGVNAKHGVDLTGLNFHKVRGSRGGLMHNKFCVVDNQIVVTGSYNWSSNAEYRNDENILVAVDPKQATKFSVEFNRLVRPDS